MERRIVITPAFDKRHPDPHKNYGIHNAELHFYLIGPEGVIQFVVSTGWDLPHVAEEFKRKGIAPSKAWGTDIGYHSYVPRYEGQTPLTDSCPLLGGKQCYYDGSTLNAEPIFNRMVAEGHEAVWEELERWYIATFATVEQP